MTDGYRVRVVCTDRGAHSSREIALWRYDVGARPVPWWWPDVRMSRRGDPVDSVFQQGMASVEFRCPTCRRDVRLSFEVLTRILDAYREAGRVRFDISLIPS